MRAAARSLFATGNFDDIQIGRDSNVLVVVVAERPSISEINIDGNKAIETEALLDGLKGAGLAVGQVFQRSTLEGMQLELQRQYVQQGRYDAAIETEGRSDGIEVDLHAEVLEELDGSGQPDGLHDRRRSRLELGGHRSGGEASERHLLDHVAAADEGDRKIGGQSVGHGGQRARKAGGDQARMISDFTFPDPAALSAKAPSPRLRADVEKILTRYRQRIEDARVYDVAIAAQE